MLSESFDDQYERRFAGIARLYGEDAFALLQNAHVAVVGLGGVGSWAAEALARTAIGKVTLIDLDVLVASNVNRQLPAVSTNLGKSKVDAMAERLIDINPRIKINRVDDFLTRDNISQLLSDDINLVLDCTDDVSAKVSQVMWCRRRRIPLVLAGAAGGKTDPSQLRIADLSQTHRDPLLAKVRRILRKDCGLSSTEKLGFPCVYSDQAMLSEDAASCETGDLSCTGYGSCTMVTNAMAMFAVGEGIKNMLRRMRLKRERAQLSPPVN